MAGPDRCRATLVRASTHSFTWTDTPALIAMLAYDMTLAGVEPRSPRDRNLLRPGRGVAGFRDVYVTQLEP